MPRMNFTISQRQVLLHFATILALGLALPAHAQATVEAAWARATVPNQSATGAFMRLTAQKDVVLTRVSSPMAGIVEVHEMSMDNGIMRMRAADRVALKAGQTIELKSGGLHIMMMDLKQQIKAGESVPLTLLFKGADGTVSKVETQAVAGFAPPAR